MEDTEPQIIIWLGSYLEHCPLFILRTAFFVWYIFLSFVSWYFSANAFSHNESHQAGPRTTWVPLSFYLPMQILVPEKAQVRHHLPILIPWPCSTLNPFLSCSPDGIIWYIIQYSNVLMLLCFVFPAGNIYPSTSFHWVCFSLPIKNQFGYPLILNSPPDWLNIHVLSLHKSHSVTCYVVMRHFWTSVRLFESRNCALPTVAICDI